MSCLQMQVNRLDISARAFDKFADDADAQRTSIENTLSQRWFFQNGFGWVKSFGDSSNPQHPDTASTYAGRVYNYEQRAAALRAIGDQLLAVSESAILAQDQMNNYLQMLAENNIHTSGILNDISQNVRTAQQQLQANSPLVREMATYGYRVTIPDCNPVLSRFRLKHNEK